MRILILLLVCSSLAYADDGRKDYIDAFKAGIPISRLGKPSASYNNFQGTGRLFSMIGAELPTSLKPRYKHDELLEDAALKTVRMMIARGFDDDLTMIYLNSPSGKREIRAQYVQNLARKCHDNSPPREVQNNINSYFRGDSELARFTCPTDKSIAEKAFK